MNLNTDSLIRSEGPSAAERAWREALRRAGFPVAPMAIAVHPSQLSIPGGDKRAAEAAYVDFLAAEPDNPMALDGLAFLLQHRGDWAGMLAIRRRRYEVEARQLGVADERIGEVVAFLASSLGDGDAPASAPAAYVASLFDRMADTYDEQIVERLEYRGPALLRAAVDRLRNSESVVGDVLDLGCGTGLAGAVFRPLSRRMTGVDLSPGMLDRAQQRGVYDELHRAEIVEFMESTDARYDLLVAADVLNYFGDLAPAFSAAANVLRPGGLLAVTVERGETAESRLRGMRRYQHSLEYLERIADSAALRGCSLEAVELRCEMGEPVLAWCGVWRRENCDS